MHSVADFYIWEFYVMKMEYISNLVLIYSCFVWLIYINSRITDYLEKAYLWNKILGMSEKDIFTEFQKKNLLAAALLLVIYVSAAIVEHTTALSVMCGSINMIIMLNNITILFLRSRYRHNINGKITVVGICVYYIGIFFSMISEIIAGGNAHEIAVRITKSDVIVYGASIVKYPPVVFIVVNVALCIGLNFTFGAYDDRVCEKHTGRFVKKHINLPDNFLVLLILYAADIFLAVNISHNKNAFSVLNIIIIVLISGAVDDIFHEDTCNKQWYRLLGEKYSGLWWKKLRYEAVILSVIIVVYLICAVFHHYDIKTVGMVGAYALACGVCWVTYFAYYYVKMQRKYMRFELIKMYMALVIIAVPGINLLFGTYWYCTGWRRWKKYVGD